MSLKQQFKALGDESRLRILVLLSKGFYNVQEITEVLDLAQPTVSHHLKVLSRTGFARSLRDGNHIYYSLVGERDDSTAAILIRATLAAVEGKHAGDIQDTITKDAENLARLAAKRRRHTKDYFDAVASNWNSIREEAVGQENFLTLVVEQIVKEEAVLELGCGSGALLDLLAPRAGLTIGVDCSEAMLDETRKKLGSRASKIDLRLGYIEHLPVGDESVDTVVGYMVLHHSANPKDALADSYRVLKRGGSCILVDLMPHDKEYMRERFADIWLGFAPTQVQEWLEEVGFQSVTTRVLGEKQEVFMAICKK